MPIRTQLREGGSAFVISVVGKFDFDLLHEFRQAYNDETIKQLKIIVDMKDTSTIDSSALGMLLNMQRFLEKGDGEISIVNCNREVSKVFQITRFDKKFSIE